MMTKNIIVCSEIANPEWRWVSHLFPKCYVLKFFCSKVGKNRLATMIHRLVICMRAVINARRADVIVSHGPYIAFYCALFLWLFRQKIPHVVYSFNFAELPDGMTLRRMSFLFKKIDCLVVSSTMEQSLYSQHFNIPINKIDFVHWGVAEPIFDLKPSCIDSPYISAVGGNARDYETFMSVMAQLPHLRAVAVMRPQNMVGLNVPDNVLVLTDIPKDEALSVIKNSVLTVLPLQGAEIPCGHVTIVVAMYLGVPCVVTNSSGVSDYVIDAESGLLCEPKSVDSMKEAITSIITDQGLHDKIVENSRAFVTHECTELNYVNHLKSFLSTKNNLL